ncbi:peptidoglycan DD-metalloendopeptidase family protein [Paenibacillus sonchi]|uniref:Peptidoglycan DD-metalloendopeptidase family protein n=2 Tax=Paenibacillus sonchi TaxID=373687 RepID=A0A974SGI2_9BACL|nr:M23 family metallopeptidase [Paenibacillus sonchi]QQZ63520.1 peptidoglycan DD-metalloendopeptidase family protein [Paenibacillus sonchi]
MKKQPDHNRITLLVVREAGRPVRQLQLSKPLALVLPAAAALSLSSLVTSMHFHASRSISELEAEAAALSLTNLRMEMKVADKDKALLQLRSQVTELSEEADQIKEKLKSVSELEQQLQSLIDKDSSAASGSKKETSASKTSASAGNLHEASVATATAAPSSLTGLPGSPPIAVSPASASAAPVLSAVQFRLEAMPAALDGTVTPQVGGEYIAVYQNDPLALVRETKDDYEEIRSMLDEMMSSITSTITEAQKANTAKANLQAKQARAEQARLAPAVLWPTQSKVITSSFGYRSDPFKGVSAYHSGIDIAGSIGDPIYAAMDGVVTAAEQMGARGKYIILQHDNGLETWYMHLNTMLVAPGTKVSKGQKIALLGNTGRSTGPHLHFQVVKQNRPVNPLGYVQP